VSNYLTSLVDAHKYLTMKITCGPEHDRRTVDFTLPAEKKKIAVFVSGGIDSAIIYYLLEKVNHSMNCIHEIVPVSIIRKEGSRHFSKLVAAYVQDCFRMPFKDPIIVGDNTLPEDQQVASGVFEALDNLGFDVAYTGLIQQLPIHMVNWKPIPWEESDQFKAPLKDLNKSHVIELIYQLQHQSLFHITHSCAVWELGRCRECNGCNERQWGFDQIGREDPGTI
jgi:hypothetical protein